MPRPPKPWWATDAKPGLEIIEPPDNKKKIGWVSQEKPPFQFMNWLFHKIYLWIDWLEKRSQTEELRSDSPLIWDGLKIRFKSPLQIVSREDRKIQINQISSTESPLQLQDKEVVVAAWDPTAPSPVDLVLGNYATLKAGEYCIVDESKLDPNRAENELILFRRYDISALEDEYGIGYSSLQIPFTRQMIIPTSRFYLGGKNFDGQRIYDGKKSIWYSDNGKTPTLEIDGAAGTVDGIDISEAFGAIPPVGTIHPFYDFGGPNPLRFNSKYFQFCDGSKVREGTKKGEDLPDLSNRYLVGLGDEGKGNIGTIGFSKGPLGNAEHIVDLRHAHTVSPHSHLVSPHSHGVGSLKFQVAEQFILNPPNGYALRFWKDDGTAINVVAEDGTPVMGTGSRKFAIFSTNKAIFYTRNGSGLTTSESAATTASSPTTDSRLALTSIQPRSVPVRYIMRIQ